MSQRPLSQSVVSPTTSLKNVSPSIHRNFSSQSVSQLSSTDDVNVDELFTKYTITEVKFIQHRLRADADAKQEELRLMVGERYRDLLQASSSIISIARSSKRVTEALAETRTAILAQEQPPLPKKPAFQGSDDSQLHALQLLSAHMKLLLDAPEYLWRLIEKKRYLTASWLYILSRGVNSSLGQPDNKALWASQGLDVAEQFPLIQRQDEAIKGFRQQIIHKATLSLRDYSASPEDTCATVIGLHIVDARPMVETLNNLLEQRNRTLSSMMGSKPGTTPLSPNNWQPITRRGNGHAPPPVENPASDPPKPLREVRQTMLAALEAICKTVTTARSIYQSQDSQPSMVYTTLALFQSDDGEAPIVQNILPEELQLSTPALLASMPSSTHFLLLPPGLRSFKPHVDPSSSLSSVPQPLLRQKLEDWFARCRANLKIAVDKLFLDLRSVKDVWSIRTSIRTWIQGSSGLEQSEMQSLKSVLDEACASRILSIWETTLSEAEHSFHAQLSSAVLLVADDSEAKKTDRSPVQFLFQAPPLPVPAAHAPTDPSFQKYKAALRKQLLGRTSLLDDVLKTIETCARTIQQDLSEVLHGDGAETQQLIDKLSHSYQPQAESFCTSVLGKLESASQIPESSSSALKSLVFVGRVADELASVSTFVSDMSCGERLGSDFRRKSRTLHDKIIDRWRMYTVSSIVDDHLQCSSRRRRVTGSEGAPSPSPELVESLLRLSRELQELGLPRNLLRRSKIISGTLHRFITHLTANANLDATSEDIKFLKQLGDYWEGETGWDDLLDSLGRMVAPPTTEKMSPKLPNGSVNSLDSTSEYLIRTQLLFATLLPHPPKSAPPTTGKEKANSILLPYGIPQEVKYHDPVEHVTVSSRFSELLVNSGQ